MRRDVCRFGVSQSPSGALQEEFTDCYPFVAIGKERQNFSGTEMFVKCCVAKCLPVSEFVPPGTI